MVRARKRDEMDKERAVALTVGQLRAAIDGLADSVEVVIQTDGWYDNIRTVIVPSVDGVGNDYVALTLVPASLDNEESEYGDWDCFQGWYAEPAEILRPVGGEVC